MKEKRENKDAKVKNKDTKVRLKFEVNGEPVLDLDKAWEKSFSLSPPVSVKFIGFERPE